MKRYIIFLTFIFCSSFANAQNKEPNPLTFNYGSHTFSSIIETDFEQTKFLYGWQ